MINILKIFSKDCQKKKLVKQASFDYQPHPWQFAQESVQLPKTS